MNSSNDPLDKLLQQRFQQLFEGEQAVPDTSLKQKIWARLPPPPPRRSRPVSLLWLGLLFLVGGGLYYGAASFTREPKGADLTGPQGVTQPVAGRPSAGRPSAGRPSAGRHPANSGSVSQAPVKPSVAKSASLGGPVDTQLVDVTSPANPSIGRSSLNGSVGPLASPTTDLPRLNRSPKAADYPRVSGSRNTQLAGFPTQERRLRRLLPQSSIQRQSASQVPVQPPTTRSGNDSSTHEPVPTWGLFSLYRRPLEGLLGNKFSALVTRRVNVPAPAVAFGQTALTQSAAPPEWFFTATPLSTYQRMTIVAKTDTYLRDVSSPNPWSTQTWGYQLSGGIRWWGWDAAVSYGQLRRWAYYERAIDAYQVELTSPTTYQVKRRTEAVAENVSLSSVGLSLGKQYTWGKHRRYYARASTQLAYILTTHQPLGWLQAGWGLSLPLGKWHQLQIGPAIAYSLSDSWSTDRQLQIHPYTAGLSLTIRP